MATASSGTSADQARIAALEDRVRQLERVMIAAPAAIYISDRALDRTVFANEGMTRLLGYSTEELCAMPAGGVRELIHPDDLGTIDRLASRSSTAPDGTVIEGEYRIRAKDGRYVWLRDRTTILARGEDGSVSQTLGVAIDIGERLETEQALAERSAELEQVMLAAPAAIWISRRAAEGAIESNALGRAILGLSEDAPMGTYGPPRGDFTNGRFVKPDGEPFGRNDFPLARALAGERVEGLEIEVAYPDRPSRHLLVNAQPFGAAQSPSGAVAVGIDVSERHQLTHELRELNADLKQRVEAALAERALLADIIDETDAFVQVAAPDYTFLAINAASARQFKRFFKREARIGENILDLLAEWPKHRANAKALWGRAFAGESFTQVREFDLGNAGRRYYESRYKPLRNEDGEIAAAYQFVTDITDRMRSEARLRTIFDTSFQFQSLMDLDGTLREANATALSAIGCSADEVIGRKMWDTPWFSETPGLAERVARTIAWVAKSGEPVRAEIPVNFPQGRRVFDFSIRPMLDPAGTPVGLISEATELTALREAEAALLQVQKLESMGQLTGGVAHDFNNLLTPILGALDLLQRRGIGNELEQSLIAGAIQSADRARTLVQRLLAFARRQPLQPVPVDIAKLVTGMADLVARTTGPQVRVATEITPGLPSAVADANQLELAILNLAVNARDAMPDGGTLRITAGHRQVETLEAGNVQPGRYICLSVADTGTGMDEDTRTRAIEPFFSTKGVGQGTGLGLSMAHGLASQLGGALTIDSYPGAGTNITLWLPATDRAVDGEETAVVTAKPGKGRVLLVDDEPLVRATTAGMLGELGYDVSEAESGEAAIQAFEGGLKPDFLVTDHLMPGMSGPDLARIARERMPGIRILVISGYAERKGVDPQLARLAKPFRSNDLAEAMSALSS